LQGCGKWGDVRNIYLSGWSLGWGKTRQIPGAENIAWGNSPFLNGYMGDSEKSFGI
jgi:hypothetical protein